MEMFEFSGYNNVKLQAYIWKPDGEIKSVLQLSHGMTEHIERYKSFAEYLCGEGVAVVGFDLRGHGRNMKDSAVASFGEGGWVESVEDYRLFYELISRRFSGVPYYMLGFSLGSFLLRDYLTKYSSKGELAGAIIMGTGQQPKILLSVLMKIVKQQIKKVGFDRASDLVRTLSFGMYNQKFKPNRTTADWLSSDENQVDAYLNDSLSCKDISAGLMYDLLDSMKRNDNTKVYDTWDKSLPILLISGVDDPVGSNGKGVKVIYRRMKKSGMKNLELNLIPNARHAILHEKKDFTESVQAFILQWIHSHY